MCVNRELFLFCQRLEAGKVIAQNDGRLSAFSNTSVDLCPFRLTDKRKKVDRLQVQARVVNRAFAQS